MYIYQHFEILFVATFATLVNTYLTKSLPHIHSNPTVLCKECFYTKFADYTLARFNYNADWHHAQMILSHPIMLTIMLA